jgi:hypothetical protein
VEVTSKPVFFGGQALRSLVISLLFAAAFGLRLYHIGDPPMDFQAVRQYHSALLARGFYETILFGQTESVPPDGIIEPPIIEALAAFAYYLFGGEYLWIPRLFSAMFWMVGGVFLYLIAKQTVSPNAAVFSTFFYLFDPFAVLSSRSFQPDPLMIMLLLISIFTILRYHEQPSTRRVLVAALASSIALVVKPGVCFFQIFGVFVSLTIYREGIRKSLFNVHLLIFAVLSLLPTGLYYLYNTTLLSGGNLQGQAQGKIVPQLLLGNEFWQYWLLQIRGVVGFVALVGALLGVLLFRRGLSRALIIGLWGGYFLFGLAFANHIRTHDYYSLQLIPVVALSLGSLWDVAMRYLVDQRDLSYFRRLTASGLIIFAFVLTFAVDKYQVQQILGIAHQGQGKAFPGEQFGSVQIADYKERVRIYQEVGEVVNHSPQTLILGPDYGYSLLYHGRLSGPYWPPPGEGWFGQYYTSAEYFDLVRSEASPEYFIVIKRFHHYIAEVNWYSAEWGGPEKSSEYEELRNLLTASFPTIADTDTYVVFDLK